ncbi:MAG: DUF485 domain-containing protein [Tuberibacillus sp.]
MKGTEHTFIFKDDSSGFELYKRIIVKKKRLVFGLILFFICFYFALPVGIICFPVIMSARVISHFTVAWIFAFLQFVMIWGLGSLYYYKAKKYDKLLEKAVRGEQRR